MYFKTKYITKIDNDAVEKPYSGLQGGYGTKGTKKKGGEIR